MPPKGFSPARRKAITDMFLLGAGASTLIHEPRKPFLKGKHHRIEHPLGSRKSEIFFWKGNHANYHLELKTNHDEVDALSLELLTHINYLTAATGIAVALKAKKEWPISRRKALGLILGGLTISTAPILGRLATNIIKIETKNGVPHNPNIFHKIGRATSSRTLIKERDELAAAKINWLTKHTQKHIKKNIGIVFGKAHVGIAELIEDEENLRTIKERVKDNEFEKTIWQFKFNKEQDKWEISEHTL